MKNIEVNTLLPTKIYRSSTEELSTFDKGHTIFFKQMSLEKLNARKLVQQLLRVFIIMKIFEYKQGYQ